MEHDSPKMPSAQRILTKLLSVSSNRSCADCRSTLVDPSQIHASVSPELENSQTRIPRYKNFRFNHRSFAPPGTNTDSNSSISVRLLNIPKAYDPPIDPALVAPTRVGGHGVFICALCGAAHKLLGKMVAVVHSVQDVASWSHEDVQVIAKAGGNARSWEVLEAYVPQYWESKRPRAESDIAERLTFIRAKYEALAFVLPPPGPLAFHAWRRIVRLHPEWHGLWGADLYASTGSEVFNVGSQIRRSTMHLSATATAPRKADLPDRLVDYFCVVSASDSIDPTMLRKDLSILNSPEDILLIPQVADCFPLPETYGRDQEFPEHVSTFLFPDGCRPSLMSLPPSFFTFVLTASNGDRLYGGVLRLYDDVQDIDFLRQAMDNSDYTGRYPHWLHQDHQIYSSSRRSKDSATPDVVFLPKCLVVISHYPFFDLWRKFLLQLYRIALVGAPLPIERFIANFTCEVPLPPPGKIRIKLGFTIKDNWTIERPPENQLPMADFSFQPLFASLSVQNILIVVACLLQESRVALVSKYYGMLGPVAEALTSVLFPFHWEGMYLPVLPYHMLDILDAPVPYLVCLHSRYLMETTAKNRPHGVVFVDLDKDEVHLGFEENSNDARQIPCLPERQAFKLKAKLDEFASNAYLIPPSGQMATVTTGEGEPIPMAKRVSYLNQVSSELRPHVSSGGRRRRDVFSGADKAYRDNELQVPIHGFLSEHGQLFGQDPPTPMGTVSKSKFPIFRRGLVRSSSIGSEETETDPHARNLLDRDDPPGFSTPEIRRAFLRFFVALLLNYREHLKDDDFRAEDFIDSLHLTPNSTNFVRLMVKTQMFHRFIDERRESSFDPEVKFFDESIVAKIKRSKRNALANIGRQTKKSTATGFLEDNSTMVTETFTPPPPSNWGLPDDGRTYSYGTFPTLNPDLFGKIRPPRKWHTARRSSLRMSRRTSVRTAVSEQAIFAKAMVPVVRSGSSLIAATRRGAKSLEQAITALSAPFVTPLNLSPPPMSKNNVTATGSTRSSSPDRFSITSDITVPSELALDEDLVTSAEEVVLNARRKQAILLGIIMIFQLQCKARLGGSSHSRQPSLRNILQLASSDTESAMAAKDYFAAVKMQALVRGNHSRFLFRRARSAASTVQAGVRGRRTRFAYLLMRRATIQAQARCRGHVVRIQLTDIIRGRLSLYRVHIFCLWKQAGTSLCFRTIFWSSLQKSSIMQLSIAEVEVRRLWKELQISLPSMPAEFDEPHLSVARMQRLCESQNVRLEGSHRVLSSAASLGLTNRIYFQVLKLQQRKLEDRKPMSTKQKQVAVTREQAERIQVYDKLSVASLFAREDRLSDFFQRFRLPLKDKRKKMLLSEMIWSDIALANESSRLMLDLFPELAMESDMHFSEPCKKTKSRFKNAHFRPDPLDHCLQAHGLFHDRIRRHVHLVADVSLRLVPKLSTRFARLDEKQAIERRECNRRLYFRMAQNTKTQELSQIRIAVMKELLQCRGRPSNHVWATTSSKSHKSLVRPSYTVTSKSWSGSRGTHKDDFKENRSFHQGRPFLAQLQSHPENGSNQTTKTSSQGSRFGA